MTPALLTHPPEWQHVAGRWLEMLGPIVYRDPRPRPHFPRGFVLEVPPFFCDGASIPKLLHFAFRATWQELLRYGGTHDYLYRKDAFVWRLPILVGAKKERVPIPSRSWADHIGADVILVSTTTSPRWDRMVALSGTRVGGRGSWHQKAVDWRPEGLAA